MKEDYEIEYVEVWAIPDKKENNEYIIRHS